jgi:trypsin
MVSDLASLTSRQAEPHLLRKRANVEPLVTEIRWDEISYVGARAVTNPKDKPEAANEKGPTQRSSLLDALEQISRISVPIMIPVVIALIGYFGNNLLNQRQSIIEQKKLELEYVKIAKDTLSNVKPETDTILVSWAYQTFFQLSPVKVSQEDVDDLSKRRVPLPSSTPPTVLGGVSSSLTDWPWLVSLFEESQFVCNGTVIAAKKVLSTAHCVAHGRPGNIEVVTATGDGKNLRISRRIQVSKIIVHPAFSSDDEKNDNDIAILELSTALPPPFAMISAQSSTDPKVGGLALVAAIDFRSEPGNLLQGSIPIVDGATCVATYDTTYSVKLTSQAIICAGFEHGGFIACPGTGSAGGPLVVLDGAGQKYQIGIVSLGQDCSRRGAAYGVYTRVSSYSDWIRQVVPEVFSEPIKEVKR